jgi:hypothetical protein
MDTKPGQNELLSTLAWGLQTPEFRSGSQADRAAFLLLLSTRNQSLEPSWAIKSKYIKITLSHLILVDALDTLVSPKRIKAKADRNTL